MLNLRNVVLAAVVGAAAFGAASVAQAHDHHWKRWGWHAPYYVTAPGYYYPPVVYAPRPVVVYPQPAYSTDYYAPPPGVNFNFSLPLR
jgi:hypothetical protein